MVYISSGVNFLGDSESEDLLYPLNWWPFIMSDPKLGFGCEYEWFYISSGVIVLEISDLKRWCLWLVNKHHYRNALGEGHVICFGTDDIYMTGWKFQESMNLMRVIWTLTVHCLAKMARALGRVRTVSKWLFVHHWMQNFKKGMNMKRVLYHVYCPCNSHYGHIAKMDM